jgi:ribosomal protein L37AE/L43A
VSTALIDSPHSLFGEASTPRPSGGPRMTLEERLDAVLHAARSEGRAECPVCHATMRHDRGAARCSGCGSAVA